MPFLPLASFLSSILLLLLLLCEQTTAAQQQEGVHHLQTDGVSLSMEQWPAVDDDRTLVGSMNDDAEERLAIDVFRDYNSLIRPSPCRNSSIVRVQFGMAMILLINVDEKNQIMQSNVWLTLKWNDCQLVWDPTEYGGLRDMRVPQERVWVPDIVLFNNADGNYEVSYRSNVLVDHDGNVTWVPPAIYKSSCKIDVEYFPFDEQVCMLIFGSWTYNAREVQLQWYNNIKSVVLDDYSPSGIWDVMDVPGQLSPDKSKIVFQIVIRRKTLFYTVILIIPTVLMAFLSMLVFYLPAECSEKITLTISILLALVVFLLLVSKILPPTSDSIPLIAKYMLMTFVLNIMTIMSTVVIINIYFRSAISHTMPTCVRWLFLGLLPRLLLMKRPERIPLGTGHFVDEYDVDEIFDKSLVAPTIAATMLPFTGMAIDKQRNNSLGPRKQKRASRDSADTKDAVSANAGGNSFGGSSLFGGGEKATVELARVDETSSSSTAAVRRLLIAPPSPFGGGGGMPIFSQQQHEEHHRFPKAAGKRKESISESKQRKASKTMANSSALANLFQAGTNIFGTLNPNLAYEQRVGREVSAAVESIAYVAEHMKAEMSDKKVRDDWRYISMVVDRVLLLTFFGVTLGGTIGIIFTVPHIFEFVDQKKVLRELIARTKLEAAGI